MKIGLSSLYGHLGRGDEAKEKAKKKERDEIRDKSKL